MADRWRDEDRNRWDPDYSERSYRSRYARDDDSDYRDRDYGRSGRYGDYGRGAYGTPYGDYSGRPGGYGGGYGDDARRGYGRGDYGGAYGTHRRQDREGGYGRDDRDWTDRAGDEVASWFGDEEAERRRRQDELRDYNDRGRRGYTRADDRMGEGARGRFRDDW